MHNTKPQTTVTNMGTAAETFFESIYEHTVDPSEHLDRIAPNPNTLPEALNYLLNEAGEQLTQYRLVEPWIIHLLKNPALKPDQIEQVGTQLLQLYRSNEAEQTSLEFIANPNCPEHILQQIDLTPTTCLWLTQNPNCPTEILQNILDYAITQHEQELTESVILSHRNCPEKLKQLAYNTLTKNTENAPHHFIHVATNPTLTEDQMLALTNTLTGSGLEYLLQNPEVTHTIIEKTYHRARKTTDTITALLQNPNFDQKHLQEIAQTVPAAPLSYSEKLLLKHLCVKLTDRQTLGTLLSTYGICAWRGVVKNQSFPLQARTTDTLEILADDTLTWEDTYDVYLGLMSEIAQKNNYKTFNEIKLIIQTLDEKSSTEESSIQHTLGYNKIVIQHLLNQLPLTNQKLTSADRIWIEKYGKDNQLTINLPPQHPTEAATKLAGKRKNQHILITGIN